MKTSFRRFLSTGSKLVVFLLLAFCALSLYSCSDDNNSITTPKYEYEATNELQRLVEDNPELKTLLTKAIEKGKTINPDKQTNPVQSLEEYYAFVDWTQHAMPWNVVSFTEGTDIFKRIDQSLNYFFFINDIPLEELD